MTFEELLDAANDGGSRGPGRWTPTACKVWREADPEDARLLEAAISLEMVTGRHVQVREEADVRERLRQMHEATAAAIAAKADV